MTQRLLLGLSLLAWSASAACIQATAETPQVVVYKTPTCGCCGVYATEMEKEGYRVKTVDLPQLHDFKTERGIPRKVWDCHTALVGDYYLEGHVPFEAVAKLLSEKPDIAGLALPNMPTGTPGMPGPKNGPFVVLQIDKQGNIEEYGRY